MAIPVTLSSLSEREAVTDALYRCILGFDRSDYALFDSSITADAKLEIGGRVMEGRDAILAGCYNHVASLDTTHSVTNVRVDVKDGASTASVTATGLNQHHRPGKGRDSGEPGFMAGGFYDIDCVKDEKDGLWKIKYFKLTIVWTQGDRSVMSPP